MDKTPFAFFACFAAFAFPPWLPWRYLGDGNLLYGSTAALRLGGKIGAQRRAAILPQYFGRITV